MATRRKIINYEHGPNIFKIRNAKKRLLVFIVAYHAENTIAKVLQRIPDSLIEKYDTEILIIDDASSDKTVKNAHSASLNLGLPFKVNILVNPENQGYGGNQKIGFQYAIEKDFDLVALVHGDGQYAPEFLPELLRAFASREVDAVFGSRMMKSGEALKGGMPLYKYIGNKILTNYQNIILKSNLSEFHSGYRVYAVSTLKRIPFHLNTNDFHFDTEIIIQILFAGMRIKEMPIPTYYGEEICYVNGFKYAFDVFRVTLKAVVQRLGIIYDKKFDCAESHHNNKHYLSKVEFNSPPQIACQIIPADAKVLDIGSGSGHLAEKLSANNCEVTGIDQYFPEDVSNFSEFYQCDLNKANLPVEIKRFNYILLLDILEHLLNPEEFIEKLRRACRYTPDVKFIVSTGNIAFCIIRLMLLIGQFNYGKRGILDLTHTRLFTFRSFRKLFENNGFEIVKTMAVPAPLPLAFGKGKFSSFMMKINQFMIKISKSLFAYQICMVVRPKRSLALLLKDAQSEGVKRLRNQDNDNIAIAV